MSGAFAKASRAPDYGLGKYHHRGNSQITHHRYEALLGERKKSQGMKCYTCRVAARLWLGTVQSIPCQTCAEPDTPGFLADSILKHLGIQSRGR